MHDNEWHAMCLLLQDADDECGEEGLVWGIERQKRLHVRPEPALLLDCQPGHQMPEC